MNQLHRLNYHHLYYFFQVARLGSITRAAQELRISQPTVSAQLRLLEDSLGHLLIERKAKSFRLTEMGLNVLRHAEQIFRMGGELLESLDGHALPQAPLRVGILDVVPKFLVHKVLAGALAASPSPRFICIEGSTEHLLGSLAGHHLDLVLTDSMVPSSIAVRAYHHPLGESGVTFMAVASLARRYRRGFPHSLHDAPLLLPTELSAVRAPLEEWLRKKKLEPRIVGEFQDSALMKIFGRSGLGIFLVPTAVEKTVQKEFKVSVVGRIPDIRERFFLISIERKLTHPGALEIIKNAHRVLDS